MKNLKIYLGICAAGCSLWLAGCAGNIGGVDFPLNIVALDGTTSVPATAYVVPYEDWVGLGAPTEITANNVASLNLGRYKVTSGSTPVVYYGESHRVVVVVAYKDNWFISNTKSVPGENPPTFVGDPTNTVEVGTGTIPAK